MLRNRTARSCMHKYLLSIKNIDRFKSILKWILSHEYNIGNWGMDEWKWDWFQSRLAYKLCSFDKVRQQLLAVAVVDRQPVEMTVLDKIRFRTIGAHVDFIVNMIVLSRHTQKKQNEFPINPTTIRVHSTIQTVWWLQSKWWMEIIYIMPCLTYQQKLLVVSVLLRS